MVPIDMHDIIQIGHLYDVKKVKDMSYSHNPLLKEKLPSYRKTQWYEIDGDDYLLKRSSQVYTMINLINEFVGMELASWRKLRTAKYNFFELANLNFTHYFDDYITVDNRHYILVTKSFLEKNKTYFYADELFHNIIVKEYRNDNNVLNHLLSLRSRCFNPLNYKRLINDLLELTILDFFMGQWDRDNSSNFMFEQKESFIRNLSLSDIYDYAGAHLTADYSSEMDVYTNFLGTLRFPSQSLIEVNDKFPELSSIMQSYVDLDARKFVDSVQTKNNFLLNPNISTKFNDFFEQKQEILVKCLR